FLHVIKDAYDVLSGKFDIIVIEGAGSPAEINIKDKDIVNMKMAEMANAPVLLVTDIDRGGSFAWIVGTLQLLSETEKERIKGVIFNKFRGDIGILIPGYKMLEEIINKPVLGTVPHIDDIQIDDEDSVVLEDTGNSSSVDCRSSKENYLDVVVIKHSRISNFTDFDLLGREHGVLLRYVNEVDAFGNPDLVIIPGTKGTINDLKLMRKSGLAAAIINGANNGCAVIGICGGYQMLGNEIRDTLHVESDEDSIEGLGLINAVTDFVPGKETHQSIANIISGALPFEVDQELTGYEIHMGSTRLLNSRNGQSDKAQSGFLKIVKRSANSVNINDGAVIVDNNRFVIGTYLHGIFDNDGFRIGLLNYIAKRRGKRLADCVDGAGSLKKKPDAYERLADVIRESLNMDLVYKIINGNR
ncbi:MAG: cobyric acid synthase, partial [Candidatus Anammoxibacter sp.]